MQARDETTPEEELVARSKRGDLAAFNQLVVRYQDRVYNLCLRMLGSPEAAEDATQEAFLSAYRRLGQLRGGNVRSWLLRIAANACHDEIRRRRRRRELPLLPPEEDAAAFEPVDPDPGPESQALRGELAVALQRELLRLPEEQRLAVLLCDLEGLSYDEIAAAMGCSVGTVKSRISRGRARLRDLLRARPELFAGLVRLEPERS